MSGMDVGQHKMKKILIATGGTGGHIYPALVTAQALKAQGWDVLFIGKFASAKEKIASAGFSCVDIQAQGFVSRGPLQMFAAFGQLVKNFFVCAGVVLRYRPSVVLGFGGYSSFPTVFSGALLGARTIIHEQNAVPGLANKILAKCVKRIGLAFKDARKAFPANKTVWVGCPLRPLAQPRPRADVLRSLGLEDGRKTILIFGGSQGARAVNQAVVQALENAAQDTPWQVIHLTGKGNLDAVQSRYKKISCPVFLNEYADNMADLYAVADVVIARSGAGTVTELGLLAIPSILIPYPGAQNHQIANARVLKRLGMAEIIEEKDLKAGLLRDKIFSVLQTPFSRQEVIQTLRNEFAPDAVERLVSEIENLAHV